MRNRSRLLLVLALLAMPALDLAAQRRGGGRGNMYGSLGDPNEFYQSPDWHGNAKYDGRFVFARIKYRGFEHYAQEGPGWHHDYPRAESHFMRIMKSITTLRPFIEAGNIEGGNILALDDPELFKYPIAYLSEPGGWHMTQTETLGLRNYLTKGGFLIVDDFEDFDGGDLPNFRVEIAKALPAARLIEIPADHPVFDSFFRINLDLLPRGRRGGAVWYGVFQDNDPKKRLMVVANYLNDIGEAWEWSDRGFNVAPTNEAYKLGVNYLIYALTH
jgi:hypothetical protein